MNQLTNTGYGTQNESSGGVSIGVLFAMPTSGTFIMPRKYQKHGLTYTKTWYMYYDMIKRCHDPDNLYYNYYGARGIAVCDEWKNNIVAFHDYMSSLLNAWLYGYSIDRINNDGNYEPGNVKWSTRHEQAANKSTYKNNKTGVVGVFFNKVKKKYSVSIAVNKRRVNLGYYNSIESALKVRNNYIIKNELWEYPIQKM